MTVDELIAALAPLPGNYKVVFEVGRHEHIFRNFNEVSGVTVGAFRVSKEDDVQADKFVPRDSSKYNLEPNAVKLNGKYEVFTC